MEILPVHEMKPFAERLDYPRKANTLDATEIEEVLHLHIKEHPSIHADCVWCSPYKLSTGQWIWR